MLPSPSSRRIRSCPCLLPAVPRPRTSLSLSLPHPRCSPRTRPAMPCPRPPLSPSPLRPHCLPRRCPVAASASTASLTICGVGQTNTTARSNPKADARPPKLGDWNRLGFLDLERMMCTMPDPNSLNQLMQNPAVS